MTFERPWALLGLLALPLLAWLYVVLQRRRARYAVSFTNLAVLREVARRRASAKPRPGLLLDDALGAPGEHDAVDVPGRAAEVNEALGRDRRRR